MNRFILATVSLLLCSQCIPNLRAESPYAKIDQLRFRRALGAVTLRVVDSLGVPVTNAMLSGAFWPSDSSTDAKVFEGSTGTNGLFTAEGETIHSMNYTITKEGFYKTTGEYSFRRRGEDRIRDGRWQPWNPTNTVVLKERRNPVAMYAKNVDVSIPIRDAAVGFDLVVGDWVAPHGKGSRADVFFTYRAEIKDYWTGKKELIIACTNRLDGFYRAQKETWTEFNSVYEAAVDDYRATVNLILDATKEKMLKSEGINESEYLVFRVRAVIDDKGEIISANYGKIYGRVEYGAGEKLDRLRFTYYFNPTPNDRNLEFDPSRNLFGATDKRRVYHP